MTGRVTGIGGVFFRARDPAALAGWYETHLGIAPVPTGPDTPPWIAEGGATVFAPFPTDTDYFGRPEQQFMINFRVDDLDALCARLASSGIGIIDMGTMEGIGRFVHIHDPEGNRIELWQPA
jgi:glyoxylase I family protein